MLSERNGTTTSDVAERSGDDEPVVELRNITKWFGQVQALSGLDLSLYHGEVLALVGDNGAGKSTAIKIITGVHQPDGGEIRVRGRVVRMRDPSVARSHGIATVYQNLALVEPLDVVANLFLGRERGPWWKVNRRAMFKEAADVARTLEVRLPDLSSAIGLLSGGQRQAVAVGRAVLQGAQVVILDEPTTALGVVQRKQVLELVRRLRQQGCAVLVVSHSLEEVAAVADRIHVIRLGTTVGVRRTEETNLNEIVSMITGVKSSA